MPLHHCLYSTRAVSDLDVAAALTHAGAAHAREICFPARFYRQPRVHQVIPRVPFPNSVGVHCADEISGAERGRDENFLRAHAVELGDREVGQLIVDSVVAAPDLLHAEEAVAIGVDPGERFRQESLRSFG
jgi:hypothetical protein